MSHPLLLIGCMVWTVLFTVELHAEWEHTVKDAWDATREAGREVLDGTSAVGRKAMDATEALKSKAVTSAREWMSGERNEAERKRFDEVWEQAIAKLDRALAVNDTLEQAPDSNLFGPDKVSIRRDFNDILAEMLAILEDPRIDGPIMGIHQNRLQIDELEASILRDKEARITAPVEHVVKSTQRDLDQRIKQSRDQIVQLKNDINHRKTALQTRLQEIGITLSPAQLDAMLARVDAEDILQMAAIFDILKQITQQLMTLTRESGENLQAARRYYGMHMVLLESVVYMQKKYIDQVESRYISGILQITDETEGLAAETQRHLQETQPPQHRQLYEHNLAAQHLTLNTARLYLQHLRTQRLKVEQAMTRSMNDLDVARNTYRTVRVGSQLMALLHTSQQNFDAIMGLQIPEIVPFENLEMHKKYEELSSRLEGRTH
ncbi:MAG: hypothetical protein HQL85_08935 [Magnetococcales bacterium]|nr:hypothetical protein [Magnetococcales bacterium]MBF0172435.1 hypothetical protein [Magnetococcales bacterium]MBF0347718.1 hypothetical protein [Magnetococcales bacterium]